MKVNDLIKLCAHLKVEGENDISEDYVERIFLKKDMGQWEKILTEALGPAVKQAGEETTELFFNLTINYGGILDDQILYYKKFEDNSIIAMFWPWKDNNQVTLKIAGFKE